MGVHRLLNTADLTALISTEGVNWVATRLLFQHNNLPIGSLSPDDIASSLGPLGCLPLIVDTAGVYADIRWVAQAVRCNFPLEILAADLFNNIDITSHTGFESSFVGEFPTRLFNACAMPAENGVLVLVDSGLIRVMFYTLTVSFLARTGMLPLSQAVVEISNILSRYVRNPVNAYSPGTWSSSQQSRMDRTRTLLSRVDPVTRMYALSALAWYVIKFTICHECGHILLGHVRPDRTTVVQSPVGELNIADRHWPEPWKMELEADAVGADLLLKSDNRSEPSIRMARAAAPLLVFHMLGIIYRALSSGHGVSDTHPPSKMRESKMLSKLIVSVNEKQAGKVRGLARDFSIMERLVLESIIRE